MLDYAATHLDVLTIKGDSSSIEVLENAEVWKANLVIAVTTSEKTNLITAILAKKMGARRTIARVSSSDYLDNDQRPIFNELGVDSLISPRQLAAKEIQRLVDQCSFTDIFEFENGKISLVGITLNQNSILINKRLKEVEGLDDNVNLRPIAILRGHQTIIPRGDTYLLKNDHVYFIARKENIEKVEALVGGGKMKIKNIMILGGTGLGFETAKMLEKDYNVTIIEKKKENCKILSEHLDHALVINGDGSNIGLLEEEGLRRMDAFLALTPNSETNIIASLTAKNYGVFKTIAQVENREYTFISQDIGVDTLINKKLIAANNIFRFVRKGMVKAITSLHGVDAEVIEFVIQKENRLTKKPLRDLKFPKTALVGGVIRGEESLIPTGDFQFQVEDKVIVFALPEAISKVEQYFR